MRFQLTCCLLYFCAAANGADPLPGKDTTDASIYKVEMQFVEIRNNSKSKAPNVQSNVAWDSWRETPGAKILTAPTITMRANLAATIATIASGSINYLEPDGDNHFVLKEFSAEKIGLNVSVLVNDVDSLSAEVTIESTALDGGTDGKQIIIGVDVPIGKPVIHESSVKTKVRLVEDQASRIPIPTPAGKHAYMLLRVSKTVTVKR